MNSPALLGPSELLDLGTSILASKTRQSRFSKEPSDSPYALLPPFHDVQLASNAASSLNAPLLAPPDSYTSVPTSLTPSQSTKGVPSATQLLTFNFCGEDFSYDLDTLENDPKPIIELLKATESERGTWMMVGAHYRRSGNADAAICVIESLITLMTTQGLPERDIIPAYLLLAGCETDLAKRVKVDKPSDADEHYKRAQILLQKVYGPRATHLSQRSPSASLPRPLRQEANQFPPYKSLNNITPRQEPSQKLRLECEMQSLLKEKKEQIALLAEIRAAKRKLEDDLAYEGTSRRRLLRDYDDLQKELATARKMENYALGQVKREVDARRKAEEMARTEKGMRLELQTLFEQCTTVPGPFGDIANTMNPESA
ncbi:hypothetical protein DXG01_012189 [Tephrocybe rancida]|nr:hypothetical protein DXG01_012189 [Tephrocybe rancida]